MPTPVSTAETQLIYSYPQPLEQSGNDETVGVDGIAVDDSEMEASDESESSPLEPGSLLKELEARQDEVLESLDELDRQICDVLRNCGVTLDGEEEEDTAEAPIRHAA